MEKTLTIKLISVKERRPLSKAGDPIICISQPPNEDPFITYRTNFDDPWVTHWIEGFEFPSDEDEIKEAHAKFDEFVGYIDFKKGWLAAKKSIEKS